MGIFPQTPLRRVGGGSHGIVGASVVNASAAWQKGIVLQIAGTQLSASIVVALATKLGIAPRRAKLPRRADHLRHHV